MPVYRHVGLIIMSLIITMPQFACAVEADATEPVQDERPFPADRPGKASSPISVPVGHFMFESDAASLTQDRDASTVAHNVTIADPALKFGVTDTVDIEAQFGGYQSNRFKDRASGQKYPADGWGDVVLRTKANLGGNQGEAFALGIISYIKVPTASGMLRNAGLANNRFEGGVIAPMTYSLPHDFVAGYQVEIDASKNADDGNFHPGFVNIVSLSHPILFSDVNTSVSADDPNIFTTDVIMTYQLDPKIVLDAEADFGLNRAAPDQHVAVGLAWLF
jgi:hypothetical protein